MSVLAALTDNPYRILGIYSNDPVERRDVHADEILRANGLGETASYTTDFNDRLGSIDRSAKTIQNTLKLLEEDDARITAAFFWLAAGSASDAAAFTYLQEGRDDKAIKVFAKKRNAPSTLNLAVLAFLMDDTLSAAGRIAKLICDDALRHEFLEGMRVDESRYTPARLAGLFVTELQQDEISAKRLALESLRTESEALAFLTELLALFERLEISIQNVGFARSVPIMALKSAELLIDSTASMIEDLRKRYGADAAFPRYISDRIQGEALSMTVANINFLQTCPPGPETLRKESTKALEFLKKLEGLHVSPELLEQIRINKEALETILGRLASRNQSSGCYIATMAYGDYEHPQVCVLRDFRDRVLYRHALGRRFIAFYYANSPRWVRRLNGHDRVNAAIRLTLDAFVALYRFLRGF